jgi:hypothetical protein
VVGGRFDVDEVFGELDGVDHALSGYARRVKKRLHQDEQAYLSG